MRRFRFTIAGLAAAVAFVAIAIAALREATPLWDSVTFTLTLGVLVLATLLAVHRSGERRAFWLGWALAGSAYLGATLLPAVEPRLLSTKALAYLDSQVGSRGLVRRVLVQGPQPGRFSAQTLVLEVGAGQAWADLGDADMLIGTTLVASVPTTQTFVRIGHSLIALLLACAGALLSRQLARARGGPMAVSADESVEPNRS